MEEVWLPVVGYEGLYEISNFGVVRNISIKKHRLLLWCRHEAIYKRLALCKNKFPKHILMHRLVAEAFIENPFNLPLVCHKDETLDENWFLNNSVYNLYWWTHKDNMGDMRKKWRASTFLKYNHPRSNKWVFWYKNHSAKKVNQYSLEWEFIKEWGSVIDASIILWKGKSWISACCRWEIRTSGGFIWKYL